MDQCEMWPAGKVTCLVKGDERLCVKQAGVFTDAILSHVVTGGHWASQDGSYFFKETYKENIWTWCCRGLLVQSSVLQGWKYSGAYVDMTFLRSHAWNSMCTVLLPFLTTGGGYLLLFYFFNLTAQPHKVLGCPGIVLLYVQQPSFYKITEHIIKLDFLGQFP